MNISGIRPSESFYSYNSIKINELRNSQIMQAKQSQVANTSDDLSGDQQSFDETRARQSFSALDYASTYDPNASYDLKGADSDISKLDVEKAVSDLDKDKMLEQYQFFVGSSDNIRILQQQQTFQMDRETENFTL